MAIVRRSLKALREAAPRVDRKKIASTREIDIRRHMIEDGEDPDRPRRLAEAINPRAVRASLSMTQQEFAAAIGIPLPTLRNWEQGRTLPDPAARALLKILAREPKRALRALADTHRR